MKVEIETKIKKEFEVKTLIVDAGVRYWEDSYVNGIEDKEGDLIPCREGDRWKPIIDIESGIITNWKQGTVAKVHYKVCDDGFYHLAGESGNIILSKDGYVPKILDLYDDSYGDYIILNIDENGRISQWNPSPKINDFQNDNED